MTDHTPAPSLAELVEALELAHADSDINITRRDNARAALLSAIARLEAERDGLRKERDAVVVAYKESLDLVHSIADAARYRAEKAEAENAALREDLRAGPAGGGPRVRETVESLRQQALAIGVELAIALYGETPHPAQRGRYDREVAEATAIIDALIAAAKREGVREWIEGLAPDSAVGIAQFIDKATPRPATLSECGALMQQALLNALAKEGENA